MTGAQAMLQNRFFQRQIGAIFATPDGKQYDPDRYLTLGGNEMEGVEFARGFGDSV